ncbi:MAG: TIGR02587 family membrane protein [Vicinamibacterales bacterium]
MPRPRTHSIATSLGEYGRGVIGGLIFSLPLIYTMEVWWAGFTSSPVRLLIGLAGTFVILLGYNAVAGLHHDYEPIEVVIDSVEELGLGLVLSFCMLALLARIDPATPAIEVIGKVVVEGMLVAIGVSVGTAQLGGSEQMGLDGRKSGPDARRHPIGNVVVLSSCGAVLLAANVAPTDEIVLLGTQLSPVRLLLTMVASLVIAAVTLFFSEFHGSHHLRRDLVPRRVVVECVVAYSVAFLVSAVVLWFFGRFDGAALPVIVGETVALAFPATLGASAGRLLLQ